jgi:hypothetical protein
MGGTTFQEYAAGTDLSEAFQRARDQAAHEHGHGGYTGSLAEKGDYVVIQRDAVSLDAAYRLAEKLINDDDERISDKWGPAGAIPVFTGERTVGVDVPSGNYNDWKGAPSETAIAYLKEQKILKRGETVKSVHLYSYRSPSPQSSSRFTQGQARVVILEASAPTSRSVEVPIMHKGKVNHDTQREWEPQVKSKVKLRDHEQIVEMFVKHSSPEFKVVVESNSDMKPETRYILVRGQRHDTWETGFPTQAAARAAAVDMVNSEKKHFNPESIEIVSVTKRAKDVPLVLVYRKVLKTLATIEVRIVKTPPRSNAQPDGWLLFGWASS